MIDQVDLRAVDADDQKTTVARKPKSGKKKVGRKGMAQKVRMTAILFPGTACSPDLGRCGCSPSIPVRALARGALSFVGRATAAYCCVWKRRCGFDAGEFQEWLHSTPPSCEPGESLFKEKGSYEILPRNQSKEAARMMTSILTNRHLILMNSRSL